MIKLLKTLFKLFQKSDQLEYSEFVVAPSCTKTTINRITFEHYLNKHKNN